MKKLRLEAVVVSSILLIASSTVPAQAAPCTATDSENMRKILVEQAFSYMSGDLEPLFTLIEKARKKTKNKKVRATLTKLETKLEEEGTVEAGGEAFKVLKQIETMRDYNRC